MAIDGGVLTPEHIGPQVRGQSVGVGKAVEIRGCAGHGGRFVA